MLEALRQHRAEGSRIPKPAFEPTPKQEAIIRSNAAENLFSGSVGAGKSRVLMEIALDLARRVPGIRIGVFRKVRATLLETTIFSWLCHVNGWSSVDDPMGSFGFIKNWLKGTFKSVMSNGSEVLFFGLDKLSKIGSLELGAAFLDEAHEFDEADYDMIQTRLRQPVLDKMPLYSACNPASPSHFLYQKFFAHPDSETFAVQTRSYDNPHLPPEYLERLGRLKGAMKRRLVDGEWFGFAGVIYDCFDPNRHVVDEIPDKGTNFRAIDFGGINPHVCLWGRRTPDGKTYYYREIYQSGISGGDFGKLINTHQPPDEAVAFSVSDHDGSDRLALAKHGIRTKAARKDVTAGIEKVYERLANDEIFFHRDMLIEEDPALLDDSGAIRRRRPTSTLQELVAYEWNVTSQGNAKDEPLKRDDHGCDALRYGEMAWGGKTGWGHRRNV